MVVVGYLLEGVAASVMVVLAAASTVVQLVLVRSGWLVAGPTVVGYMEMALEVSWVVEALGCIAG